MAVQTNYRGQYLKYSRYFKQLTQDYANVPIVRVSLELLFTLATISFFAVFALRPTLNTISELIANIRSQEETKIKLEQKITNLTRAQEIFAKETVRLLFTDQALPNTPEPDSYIKQVEKIAFSRGLTMSFLKIDEVLLRGKADTKTQEGKEPKMPGIDTLTASVSVAGPYPALILFLEDLEKLRRVISVTSASFTLTRGATEGAQTLTLTLASGVPYYNGGK